MDKVINHSQQNTLAVVDVNVDYSHDPEKVIEILNEVKEKLDNKIENTVGEIEIWGLNELHDTCITYRVTVPCEPYKHFKPQRILRREIKETFAKKRIKIPFPQVEVTNKK